LIVDTSALISITTGESDASLLRSKLELAKVRQIAAPTVLETYIVLDRRNLKDSAELVDLLLVERLEVITFDHDLATLAREAYQQYGKGTGHPAQLNFGDCFSYALSKRTGYPLLCAGNDFRQTDIRIA
jgi:ribonuclease VapC